jgi:trigger factor
MNITKTNVDALNAVLEVKIEKADYEENVEKALRELRRKATVKGFRPGMVPTGLVKKMYGKGTLVEEVNKILSNSLWNFISENKIHILGEPLPKDNNLNKVDLESQPEFNFSFEIGIAPEIDITFSKSDKVNQYNISIDEETLNNYKKYYARTYGKSVVVEKSEENSILKGTLVQVNEKSETIEPIVNNEAKLLISIIKDEKIKASLTGKKLNDIINFDIKKAFPNDDEIAGLLNVKKENLVLTSTIFDFTVNEITNFVEAENNQELWDNIYGKDTITSEEQYLEKIKEDIELNYKAESDHKLNSDIRTKLLEKATFELPNEFLKKWIKSTSEKEVTDEILEKEYPMFMNDIKWQLVKENFITKHNLKITPEDVNDLAKQVALAQFRQYGINSVPDEHLEEMAGRILKNEKEKKRLEEKKIEDKVIEFVKESINLEIKDITPEDFRKLQN